MTKFLEYGFQAGRFFLVPFITIKTNLKQLDGMLGYLGRALCQVEATAPPQDKD